MPTRRLYHLPLLCVLFLCLLASPGGALGFVWCLGADGHNHAKAMTGPGGECCQPHQPAHPDECDSGLAAAASEHDQCLHISANGQLGRGSSRDHHSFDATPATTRVAAQISLPPLLEQYLSNGLTPENSLRVSETLLYHRTIVLLI